MGKIIYKTYPIFLMQLFMYITVPIMYYLMVMVGVSFNNTYLLWAPYNLFLPGCIILGLGLGSIYSLYIVRVINWYINQALVVVATVYINGLTYPGSLTVYAFSEVNKSLLVFSIKSVISRKTFKYIHTIKDTFLEKKSFENLFNHKSIFVRAFASLLRVSVSNTLDMADEVLVSYTWMTTLIYKEHGPDGKNPHIKSLIKNQAKFFLEGFLHYIRCYPKLVISTVFPMIAADILIYVVSVFIVISCFSIFGFSWQIALFISLMFASICEWVKAVFIQYAHTIIVLEKFYKSLGQMEPVSMDTLISTISSIPILADIAKKTGIKEFRNLKFESTCPEGLLDLTSIEDMVKEEASNIIDTFRVEDVPKKEEDVEVNPPIEDVLDEQDPVENQDSDIVLDVVEASEPEVENSVELVFEEEEEFTFTGLKALDSISKSEREVKKLKF